MAIIFVFTFFTLNLLTASSEDAITWPKWAYMICTALFLLYTYIVLLSKQSVYSRPIVRQYVRVLLIAFLVITYTSFFARFRGYPLFDWLTDFWSFVPLLFSFSFACFFSTRAAWLRVFTLIILLGDAASLRDFAIYSGVGRMVSQEMANVDFFIAAFICIGLIIFYENARLFLLSVVSLPLLLLRTALTGNRSMVVLLFLAVLGMLLKRVFGPSRTGKKRKLGYLGLSAGALFLVCAVLWVLSGAALKESSALLTNRFAGSGGLKFRQIEAAVVLKQFSDHPIVGSGFGSSAHFPGLKKLTADAKTDKTYVHNLLLYLMWKLGVFGILLFLMLVYWFVKAFLWTWRSRDPLPFIAYTVIFQYMGYAMLETYFRRHDYNLIVGIVLGFLIYARRSMSLGTSKSTQVIGTADRGQQRRPALVT